MRKFKRKLKYLIQLAGTNWRCALLGHTKGKWLNAEVTHQLEGEKDFTHESRVNICERCKFIDERPKAIAQSLEEPKEYWC